MEKKRNYGTMENFGTMEKSMVLYRKLWNWISEGKKHGRLSKNYETLINKGKDLW